MRTERLKLHIVIHSDLVSKNLSSCSQFSLSDYNLDIALRKQNHSLPEILFTITILSSRGPCSINLEHLTRLAQMRVVSKIPPTSRCRDNSLLPFYSSARQEKDSSFLLAVQKNHCLRRGRMSRPNQSLIHLNPFKKKKKHIL
jgi:hypothetical protein